MNSYRATFEVGTINESTYSLEGVSVITEGDALGHGVMIDSMSLASVKTCAETYSGGLKVKLNHGSGADAIVGRLNQFRIDGRQLRADLKLLKSHPMTPTVMEMAAEMPGSFGLSISFSGQIEDKGEQGMFVRCLEIYSCDIVDEPAANPSGLFSKVDNKTNATAMTTLEVPIAELTQLRAESAALKDITAQLAIANAERDVFKAELAKAHVTIADKDKAFAALTVEDTKLQADLASLPEKINAEAQRVLAAAGHPKPVAVDKPVENIGSLIDQLAAIKDPNERTRFYRQHKAKLKALRQ